MPLYEFKCKKCKYKESRIMLVSDNKEILCPKCFEKMELEFPKNVCLKFVGNGWAKDGYK